MLEFKRVKQQNFYVAEIGDNTILKSYNTIVGIITHNNYKLYQVKYSRTTSKQVSQLANGRNITDRYLVTEKQLHDIILHYAKLDIDTRYNCA
jgi:hypothetical protein